MKLFLGGPEAIRGYLIQTIMSLLESLKEDDGWINLELEPEDESEKVDIKFQYPEKKRVMQVKSSKNSIGLRQIKKWCKELKKDTEPDEYELKLFGPSYTQGALELIQSGEFNGVILLKPELIELNNLIELCAFRISKFVFNEGDLIRPSLSEDLVKILITELLLSSTSKNIISKEDLKHKILNRISQINGVVKVSVTDNDLKRIESEYFQFLKEEINESPFIGISTDKKSISTNLHLIDYYVPSQLQKYDIALKGYEVKAKRPQDRFELNTILHQNDKIILLGSPGSGKTTLLKRILLQCIDSESHKKIDDNLELDYHPLYIKCRDINKFNSFSEVLCNSVFNSGFNITLEESKYYINNLIFNKKVTLIIDGLDEISDVQLRIKFVKYLMRFLNRHSSTSVFITSRKPGFCILKEYVSKRLAIFSISELNNDGINNLTMKWYNIFIGNRKKHQKDAQILVEKITKTDSILELARNPLLLTTLLFLKHSRGIIPANKTVLYDEAINLLIQSWNIEGYISLNLSEVKAQLSFLAYTMTCQEKNHIYYDDLINIIQLARRQMPDVLEYTKNNPEIFIDLVESRSSLIILSGIELKNGVLTKRYEFKHKTFQEYLTAYAIVKNYYRDRKSTDTVIEILKPYYTNDNWIEIIPMVAVLMGRDAYLIIKTLTEVIETKKETYPLFIDPSKNALFQCILDEVQIDKNLARETILFILKTSNMSFIYNEKLLLLLKGKFKDIFVDLVISLFMENENLIRNGDLLAKTYKSLHLDEHESFQIEIIKKQLESNVVQEQIKNLLLLMVFAADLKNRQIKSNQKEEFYNLGNKIANIVLNSNEKMVYFCAIWAITQFLVKSLWDPGENQEFYNRLWDLWIKEDNEDIKFIFSWTIISLPIMDRSKISISYKEAIRRRILKNLDLEPKNLYKFYKLQKSYLAALIITFYHKLLTPEEIVNKIVFYLNVLISNIGISYASRDIIAGNFGPIMPLLRSLGKPAEPLLKDFEDIMNLESGAFFFPNVLSKQKFQSFLSLIDDF